MRSIRYLVHCGTGLLAILIIASCSFGQSQDQNIAPSKGVCEIALGSSVDTLPVSFVLEDQSTVGDSVATASGRACGMSVKVTAFVVNDIVETVLVLEPGICFEGICIGDTYENILRHTTNYKLLFSGEGGGLFAIDTGDGISFTISTAGLSIDCYDRIDKCEDAVNSAIVESIVVYARAESLSDAGLDPPD